MSGKKRTVRVSLQHHVEKVVASVHPDGTEVIAKEDTADERFVKRVRRIDFGKLIGVQGGAPAVAEERSESLPAVPWPRVVMLLSEAQREVEQLERLGELINFKSGSGSNAQPPLASGHVMAHTPSPQQAAYDARLRVALKHAELMWCARHLAEEANKLREVLAREESFFTGLLRLRGLYRLVTRTGDTIQLCYKVGDLEDAAHLEGEVQRTRSGGVRIRFPQQVPVHALVFHAPGMAVELATPALTPPARVVVGVERIHASLLMVQRSLVVHWLFSTLVHECGRYQPESTHYISQRTVWMDKLGVTMQRSLRETTSSSTGTAVMEAAASGHAAEGREGGGAGSDSDDMVDVPAPRGEAERGDEAAEVSSVAGECGDDAQQAPSQTYANRMLSCIAHSAFWQRIREDREARRTGKRPPQSERTLCAKYLSETARHHIMRKQVLATVEAYAAARAERVVVHARRLPEAALTHVSLDVHTARCIVHACLIIRGGRLVLETRTTPSFLTPLGTTRTRLSGVADVSLHLDALIASHTAPLTQ